MFSNKVFTLASKYSIMARSGSRFFFWFIFLCIAAAAYLFWKKTNGGGTSNSFITTDEVCPLLHSDNNKRAEMMFKKGVGTPNIYNDIRTYNTYNDNSRICVKFFPHQDFYYFIFEKEPDYKAFIEKFDDAKKLGGSTNCSERYAITNECIIGEMRFREGMSCFVLIVMRSPDLDKSISQFPSCERYGL